MSNANMHKNSNGNGANNGTTSGNSKGNNAPQKNSVFSKNGLDLNIEAINDMAMGASPMQLKNWITHLEALYDKKRTDSRKDLKKEVDQLLLSNDYSVEQLYAARPIPTMDELAAQARDRKKNNRSKREQMINGLLGG